MMLTASEAEAASWEASWTKELAPRETDAELWDWEERLANAGGTQNHRRSPSREGMKGRGEKESELHSGFVSF